MSKKIGMSSLLNAFSRAWREESIRGGQVIGRSWYFRWKRIRFYDFWN